MPRYFFHVHDGADYPDEEGTELANLNAAKDESLRFGAALLRDRSEEFWSKGDWTIDVKDETGLILFTLVFAGFDAPAARRQ